MKAAQAARELEKKFICKRCGKPFNTQQAGLKHLEKCAKPENDPTVRKVTT